MNLSSLGNLLIPGSSSLVLLVFGLVTFRGSRKGREAKELRETNDQLVACLAWGREVMRLAATEGWDLPKVPEQMTPDYWRKKADADNNSEMDKLAAVVKQTLGGGDDKASK